MSEIASSESKPAGLNATPSPTQLTLDEAAAPVGLFAQPEQERSAGFVWRWAVHTPLLGARLATALHVVLVELNLTVTVALAIYVSRRGYAPLHDQVRRHRQTHERP